MNHENFLNDMYCYYCTDPKRRAVNQQGKCKYRLQRKGSILKCAIGRHIPDRLYEKKMDANGGYSFSFLVNNRKDLLVELKGLDMFFVGSIQAFHDNCEYWKRGAEDDRIRKYHLLLESAKRLDSGVDEVNPI
jgi:hypothetical protein